MSSENGYSDELYFSERLSSVFDRNTAISSLVQFFNKYHWGPPEYVVCGDASTPCDQPVIKGSFLTAERMEATGLGFRHASAPVAAKPNAFEPK
jgi:hypothetical protein